jgi:hypothetical protein
MKRPKIDIFANNNYSLIAAWALFNSYNIEIVTALFYVKIMKWLNKWVNEKTNKFSVIIEADEQLGSRKFQIHNKYL